MTKADLINAIAQKTEITKKDVSKILDAFIETVREALEKGDKVILTGFGNFFVYERKERKGRNPKTGKEIKIPAKKIPKFTPGKMLRESV